MKEKGSIFVVSAPSGSGKNSVMNAVMADCPNMRYSISATTRSIRGNEVDGVNYYFVSEQRFDEMLANGELLEYTGYVGRRYGTPEKPLRDMVEQGYDVVMDVDVVGGLAIKEKIPEAVLVFLAVPSMDELRKRLIARADVKPEEIDRRIAKAYEELPQAQFYDYIVLNPTGKKELAVEELEAIVAAEKYRAAHPHPAQAPVEALAAAEKCKTVERFHLIKEELSCSTPQ